jgi:hypothetical protein
MAAWKSKLFDPGLIMKELGRVRDSDRSAFESVVAVVSSAIEMNSEIPEQKRREILIRAVINTNAKNLQFESESFVRRVDEMERKYLSTEKSAFLLLTDVSFRQTTNTSHFLVGGCRIVLNPKRTKIMVAQRQMIIEQHAEMISPLTPPTDYLPISVSVKARNIAEAADIALGKLDMLRGAWNFTHNRKTVIRTSFGARKPINVVCLNPVHTIHLESGELASESGDYWYEPSWMKSILPGTRVQYSAELRNTQRKIFQSLQRHPYKDVLVAALTRYTRSLDLEDWRASYLQLWSVFELLTATERAEYGLAIRRCAFLFRHWEYEKQVLEHLRQFRNAYVHNAKDSDNFELMLYQLKRYVETLLRFHLFYVPRFQNIGDAAQFLDNKPAIADIDRAIALLRAARKYRMS